MGKQLHAPRSLEDIELNTSQKSQSVLTWAWEFRRREKIYSAHVMQLQPTLHCTDLNKYRSPQWDTYLGIALLWDELQGYYDRWDANNINIKQFDGVR